MILSLFKSKQHAISPKYIADPVFGGKVDDDLVTTSYTTLDSRSLSPV